MRTSEVDILPFVMHNAVMRVAVSFPEENDLDKICASEIYLNGEMCWQKYSPLELNEKLTLRGWEFVNDLVQIGKRKRVLANGFWIKDESKVYILNESQYSNVGEYCMAIVADELKSILDFCQDQGISIQEIEKNDTITCYG